MSTCYRCGRQISADEPGLRRRVRTGDRTRVNYRTGKVVEGLTTFGMRTVCSRCAGYLDHVRERTYLLKQASSLAWLGGLLLVLLVLELT